ncbi:MAG TPA: ABC transporter substrate-binding protein [Egibacteraceae bacterium]|nr:ABC transporter substrate-binding protein [Egibacteraceae bacterium]
MGHTRHSLARVLALLALLALVAAACAQGGDGTTPPADDGATPAAGDDGEEPAAEGQTLVFGTSADPVVLDGILVSDGESLRAIDQMFEGLVTLQPGGTELEPGLATEWEASDDGLEWTFTLREGVTFHDGEPFNAEAVCFNFDRWYNFEGSFQNPDATYYWQTVFGGFADGGPEGEGGEAATSLYESCEATDEYTAVLRITEPSASFLPALALTNFTFGSPAALEEYGADEGEVGDDGVFRPTGTYGTEHPTGTGPFRFVEWTRNDRLVMERNPDWWGDFEGNVETLIFRPIADNAARLQALQTGEIQGYDLVEPQDIETIDGNEDLQILDRPAFNIGYVGFNQDIEPFDNIAVRQAFAHAIDRQAIIDGFYAGRGEVAHQFMPPALFGYADEVTEYEYDPDRARQILEDAGLDVPVEIDFAYPTDVSRPYMPDPEQNFQAMVADLEDCCFTVQVKSDTWSPDYLSKYLDRYGAYLLGWTGDFGDPDNFLGTFFQEGSPGFNHTNRELYNILDEAEVETDEQRRTELYEEANRIIADELPGLPYVHTEPALAFTANVSGYEPSPVSLEQFHTVTVE